MKSKPNRQNGMVLLVSLMLLLMLTLIAIAASSQSTLQVRIASNSEMRNGAFQAAEAGIAQWARAFHKRSTPLDQGTLPGGQAYEVAQLNQGLLCTGTQLGLTSCFDLSVTGRAGCDPNTSDNCVATTVHRQGGQRRNDLQQ
jgi:type IV pilus assembly protein PilX